MELKISSIYHISFRWRADAKVSRTAESLMIIVETSDYIYYDYLDHKDQSSMSISRMFKSRIKPGDFESMIVEEVPRNNLPLFINWEELQLPFYQLLSGSEYQADLDTIGLP